MIPDLVRMPPSFRIRRVSMLRQYFAWMRTWRVSRSTVSILCETTSGATSMIRADILLFCFEVGDQGLEGRIGVEGLDGADGILPDDAAAVFEFVAVDGGDDRVFDLHEVDGFGYALGLIPVDGLRAAGSDGAETAAAGTDIPKDHKGCRSFPPAFAHIGAIAAFADGMEFMGIHEAPDMLIIFSDR